MDAAKERFTVMIGLSLLIAEQAAQRGDQVAFIGNGRECTYGGLNSMANQVAHGLRDAGVAAGDRVAFLAKNSLELFEVLFGASKLNAPLVVLNWRLTVHDVAHIMGDSQARALIVGAEFAGLVEEVRPQLRPDLLVLVLDDPESYPAWRDRCSTDSVTTPSAPDDVALQLYTSGTTGSPKGVPLTNRNWMIAVEAHRSVYDIDESSVQLLPLPLFHVGGLLIGLLTVVAGGKAVITTQPDALSLLRLTEQHRVTHLPIVPAILAPFVEAAARGAGDISTLRTVYCGGSPMPESLLRAAMATFNGTHFLSGFGMTETTATVTFLTFADHVLPDDAAEAAPMIRRLGSVGRASTAAEIRIVDPQTLVPRSANEHGEILVRSGQVMSGYWNRPEATAQAMLADGWFRTGDGGYLDDDGYLFLTDRIKDMIISGGENIYPAELENVLAALPGVREATVIGVPHPRWGETPKALVVKSPDATLSAGDVIDYCAANLARYKCPTSVDWLDALPRTPSGKVMKHILRERYSAGVESEEYGGVTLA
jgi:acyl-CoA synthetase (AMP-forming)/AMP-acid ligase II